MAFSLKNTATSFQPGLSGILNNGRLQLFPTPQENKPVYADWGLEYADLALRIKRSNYHFRHELLLDLAAHLVWCGSAIANIYEYEIVDWQDIRGNQQTVYLAVPSVETNNVQADFISQCYENLQSGDNPDLEEVAFDTLCAILRQKPGHRRLNFLPRVCEITPNSNFKCIVFPGKISAELPFREEDIDVCRHPDPRLQAILRLSMIASNSYYWLRHEHRVTAVNYLKTGQGVLACKPCAGTKPVEEKIHLENRDRQRFL